MRINRAFYVIAGALLVVGFVALAKALEIAVQHL